jgi:transcriptional regulator with GAF, ATPase, and Fis domain
MDTVFSSVHDDSGRFDRMEMEITSVLQRLRRESPSTLRRLLQWVADAADIDRRTFVQSLAGRDRIADAFSWARQTISDKGIDVDAPRAKRIVAMGEMFTVALHRVCQDWPPETTADRPSEPVSVEGGADAVSLDGFRDIVGSSDALLTALSRVRQVAPTDASVLLLGETGTGKELFARAIHDHSDRRGGPFVTLNCAALPPSLVESELFGHQRGAFTGAVTERVGRFELAHRGTLFLDEIGDMPLDIQAKLLRVIQEQAFERVGSSQTRRVNVRVIAATHHELQEKIAAGTFRADLFYRLSVFPLRLPALRERLDDLPALVRAIIRKKQPAIRSTVTHVPQAVLDQLRSYRWPGNIRELENVIERALIGSNGDTLALDDEFRADDRETGVAEKTLLAVQRHYIEQVLKDCHGRINGTGNAAERLGIHPNTLRFRLKKLGVARTRQLSSPVVPPSAEPAPSRRQPIARAK